MALLLLVLLDKMCCSSIYLYFLEAFLFHSKLNQAVDRHQLVSPSSRRFYLTSIASQDAMFFCSFILSVHIPWATLFRFVSIVPEKIAKRYFSVCRTIDDGCWCDDKCVYAYVHSPQLDDDMDRKILHYRCRKGTKGSANFPIRFVVVFLHHRKLPATWRK